MKFRVKAVRQPEGIIELAIEAASQADAMQMVRAQGARVLSVTAQQSWTGYRRVQPFPLLLFTQELVTLLRAGLSLIETIESLAEKEGRAEHKSILETIVKALQEGKPFSQALSQMPAVFPELYISLVRSSERTGELDETLARYISYRTRVDQIRKKIISASIYPVLLLVVGMAVMLFLLGYVVPKFSVVYEEVSHNLPWLSQLLMMWGKFLAAHQLGVALTVVAMLALTGFVLQHPRLRRLLLNKIENIPRVRERILSYQLGRFYRSLGMLLRGGIPILTALGMTQEILRQDMRQRLVQVMARVGEGQTLSRAMADNDMMTPVALKMLRAGERAGNLGEMLERTADFYDEEMARWVDWFLKLFEPILMAVIGVLIGLIVILMYLPIFELASSIQ